MKQEFYTEPLTYRFLPDGITPNSRFPLLLYKNVPAEEGGDPATFFTRLFESHNWTNSWENGIFPYHHYHSNTHEVLAVVQGNALLHLGGPAGSRVPVGENDVLIIPAGVGHKCLEQSEGFRVVGAYPYGIEPDIYRCEQDRYQTALQNIAGVPVPDTDPLYGLSMGLPKIWAAPNP